MTWQKNTTKNCFALFKVIIMSFGIINPRFNQTVKYIEYSYKHYIHKYDTKTSVLARLTPYETLGEKSCSNNLKV